MKFLGLDPLPTAEPRDFLILILFPSSGKTNIPCWFFVVSTDEQKYEAPVVSDKELYNLHSEPSQLRTKLVRECVTREKRMRTPPPPQKKISREV
jgi:hypothetical protein